MQGASLNGPDDGDEAQNQSDVEAAVSDDETGASQSAESLQENDLQEPEEEEEQRLAQPLTKVLPAPKQQQLESKFMELPPVLEIDEEVRDDGNAFPLSMQFSQY